MFFVSSVEVNVEDAFLEIFDHSIDSRFILPQFVLVNFVVYLDIVRIGYHVSCHLFDDGGQADHEHNPCAQVLV